MRARERGTMLQAHMNEYMGRSMESLSGRACAYEYLEKMQVLGPNFLGAHSLILSEQGEILVMGRGVKTCHCPFSNCSKSRARYAAASGNGNSGGNGFRQAPHGGLNLWNEMKIFRSVMNITTAFPTATRSDARGDHPSDGA